MSCGGLGDDCARPIDSGHVWVLWADKIGDNIIRRSRVYDQLNSFGWVYLPPLLPDKIGYSARDLFPAVLFGPKSRFFFAKVGVHTLHGLWTPRLCVGIDF